MVRRRTCAVSNHETLSLHPSRRGEDAAPQDEVSAVSFDHLIGGREQCRWHNEAERLCGLEVDHKFELGRLHDRQFGGLRALENLADIDAAIAIAVRKIRSVADQAATPDIFA